LLNIRLKLALHRLNIFGHTLDRIQDVDLHLLHLVDLRDLVLGAVGNLVFDVGLLVLEEQNGLRQKDRKHAHQERVELIRVWVKVEYSDLMSDRVERREHEVADDEFPAAGAVRHLGGHAHAKIPGVGQLARMTMRKPRKCVVYEVLSPAASHVESAFPPFDVIVIGCRPSREKI